MIEEILRITITVIAFIFLFWFLSPLFFHIRRSGTVLGALICCALIFRFGFSSVYMKLKELMLSNPATTVLLRIVQIGATAFLIYAVIVSCLMIYAMKIKSKNISTAVILGAQVKPWGASKLLRQRIDAAREYLKRNPDSIIIATGGQGKDEPMSEAQCIYENLVEAGISPERIVLEDRSTNTEQNIKYSLQIIEANNLKHDITIITDSYHQLRARIIARKTDPTVRISAVNTHNNVIGLSAYPTYFVREWIAIPVEILK